VESEPVFPYQSSGPSRSLQLPGKEAHVAGGRNIRIAATLASNNYCVYLKNLQLI